MNLFCINQKNNILSESILNEFSKIENLKLCSITEIDNTYFSENNIFIFNSEFLNELDILSMDYSNIITEKLFNVFKLTKSICKALVTQNKPGKFFFITVNPSISNILNFPIAPIYDEAIHAFVKSLAKEFKPFNILFNGICVEPILEMMDQNELRTYRTKMKVYAMKKAPLKAEETAIFIKNLALTDLSLLSGTVYSVGTGMPLAY